MKKISILMIVFIMVLLTAIPALADHVGGNYTLSGGNAGVQITPYTQKTSATQSASIVTVVSMSGATAAEPLIVRGRALDGKTKVTSFKQIHTLGTYELRYYSAYGNQGEFYRLAMQNYDESSPTITVKINFTP